MEGVAGEFGKRLLAGCDSERRVAVQGASWRVEQRVRTDDFSAETTNIDDFTPNGKYTTVVLLIWSHVKEFLFIIIIVTMEWSQLKNIYLN